MTIVLTALLYLGFILIFPGLLFCCAGGLLLQGISRKLVARMQRRVGPPILQPFYDFLKLCGKETILPATANKTAFLYSPLVALAALITIQLFIPINGFSPFTGTADIIVILYLLLIPALAEIIGGSASGSPYASVGVSREMVMIIACELPLVLIFLAVSKAVGLAEGTGLTFSLSNIVEYQLANGCLVLHPSMVPAAIAFLMVIPGECGTHPFDTTEAETEIAEGLLAEYSGAPLGVFRLSHAVKLVTMITLFVALFFGGIATSSAILNAGIIALVIIAVLFISVALLHASTARLKINQIFRFYWTVVTFLAALSLVLAWFGL